MKKILILLFLFAPFFVCAQQWFTANAVSVSPEHKWHECHNRVFVGKDGNVKIFTPSNTLVYRRIGEHYTKDQDDKSMSISYKCVDDDGCRCDLSVNYMEGIIFLMLEYAKYTVIYSIIPDN